MWFLKNDEKRDWDPQDVQLLAQCLWELKFNNSALIPENVWILVRPNNSWPKLYFLFVIAPWHPLISSYCLTDCKIKSSCLGLKNALKQDFWHKEILTGRQKSNAFLVPIRLLTNPQPISSWFFRTVLRPANGAVLHPLLTTQMDSPPLYRNENCSQYKDFFLHISLQWALEKGRPINH